MHVNQELDCESPEYEKIGRKPHIKLLSSSWHQGGKWHKEWRCSGLVQEPRVYAGRRGG